MLLEQTNIPVLLLRDSLPDFTTDDYLDVMRNLVSLQLLGVTLLPTPAKSRAALQFLTEYRKVLDPNARTSLSAIRGSDERKVNPEKGRSLLRSISGVGPVLETRLLDALGSPLDVLNASEERLVELGTPASVARRVKELVA